MVKGTQMFKRTVEELEIKLKELGAQYVGEGNTEITRSRLIKSINLLLDEWKNLKDSVDQY